VRPFCIQCCSWRSNCSLPWNQDAIHFTLGAGEFRLLLVGFCYVPRGAYQKWISNDERFKRKSEWIYLTWVRPSSCCVVQQALELLLELTIPLFLSLLHLPAEIGTLSVSLFENNIRSQHHIGSRVQTIRLPNPHPNSAIPDLTDSLRAHSQPSSQE
jgi:hypothetical protein